MVRQLIVDLCYQFGGYYNDRGVDKLSTKGLYDLEKAFEFLGWEDPHVCPGPIEEDEL